jgi:hypothetical protein
MNNVNILELSKIISFISNNIISNIIFKTSNIYSITSKIAIYTIS